MKKNIILLTFLFFSFVGLAGYYGFVYLPLQEKKKEKWEEEVKKK